MKKKRFVLSMLLCFMMILQSFAYVQVFAADEAAKSPEIYTIADFGTIEGIEKSGIVNGALVVASVEETYGDAYTSAKISVKKLTTGAMSTGKTDWSEYKYLRMRFYADATGDVLNIIGATLPTADLANNPYMRETHTIAKTGWHDITLDLSKFKKNGKPLEAGATNHVPEWNEITALYLAIGHWETTFTAGHNIYIDEIWLEKENVNHGVTDSMVTSSDKVIADFTTLKSAYDSGFYPQSTNTRENGNDIYAVWDIPALQLQSKFFYKDANNAVDISGYAYANVWVYSHAPQDGGLLFVVKNPTGSGSGLIALTLAKTVDWTGWRLLSVKLGKYTNVTEIYLCVNGWANNNDTSGSSNSRWFNTGRIGIEKIWLSGTKPTAPATATAPQTAEDYDYADDVYPVVNFDAADAFYDRGNTVLSGISCITDNTYKSDVTARIKWDRAYDNSTQRNYYPFKAAGTVGQTSDEIKNTKIPAEVIKNNDYNYANFLVYNPGKKHYNSTKKVNVSTDPVSDINFVALYGSSPSDSNFSGNYNYVAVDANWTGWKVISLQLNSKADTNGIYSLYVNAGGWAGASTGWCDIGNYIDIDSVWLSKTAYSANSLKSASVANGTAGVSATTDSITYTFANSMSNNSAKGVMVYKNYVPVDPSLYGVRASGKDLVLEFNDNLEEKATYTVKFDKDMTDGSGVKLGKSVSSSFTVEDIYADSDVLTLTAGTLNGYKGMTVAEVRDCLKYSDGATLVFKNENGNISDENIPAQKGMYAYIEKNDTFKELEFIYEYSHADNFRFYMNGEETEVAFTTGTLEAKADVYCYNKTQSTEASFILAQYEGNKLINIDFKPETVSGKETLTATLEIEKVSDTSLGVFVWDSVSGLYPVSKSVKLDMGKYLWMPSVFASGSVMQRDTELNIWGEAAPGTTVTVELGGRKYTATAAEDASWSLTADAISVENNPYTMKVTTTDGGKLEFTDILAGDVWLCSGQSNMEWQMRRVAGEAADADIKAQAKSDIANSANNNIRLYNQSKNGTVDVLKDTKDGKWQYCTSTNVNNFSAVGYYFGKEIQEDLDVPVGLINASYGGAAIQGFMDKETIAKYNYNYTSSDPMRNAGRIFNAMIAPIIPYNLKGVIWYQGCANASATADTVYFDMQKVWTTNWRELWNDDDMPFIITQLAAYPANNYELVREAQYKFAEYDENVELAVIYEAGEKATIHPGDKMTVGHRLALAAEGGVYGMNVEYKYPKAESFTVDGTTLTVTFKDVYDGLKLKAGETDLNSFEILTEGGSWVSAKAEITGKNTIAVTNGTDIPVGVRAGFKGFAEPMYNLYNSADLLATPFRLTE